MSIVQRVLPAIHLTLLLVGVWNPPSVCRADPVVDLLGPPMGFMSWERFRCETDCTKFPRHCIHEDLYVTMGQALVQKGYAAAGYTQVSIDDCWTRGRDPTTGRLLADPDRFPHGISWLAHILHEKGLTLGMYGDAGTSTCAGYAGSQNHEALDAQTLADWGVDYIKYDGCNIQSPDNDDPFQNVYYTFGQALKAASRPMVYSCSYPAYLGSNESTKPYQRMFHQDGCNMWRNYADIDNTWESLYGIIRHWGDYWQDLQEAGVDGAFNDADMLLVGDDHHGHFLSHDQARLQMGFWSMIASPLFIAGDVRTMPYMYRKILLNPRIIAVNQDVSRRQADCVVGCRGAPVTNHFHMLSLRQTRTARSALSETSDVQVWSKSLQHGESQALAFLNLQTNTTEPAISFTYPLHGAVARCVDLWSDQEEDLCAQGSGNVNGDWYIELVEVPVKGGASARATLAEKAFALQIHALNVMPTSHRFLRIDYFCASSACATSSVPG